MDKSYLPAHHWVKHMDKIGQYLACACCFCRYIDAGGCRLTNGHWVCVVQKAVMTQGGQPFKHADHMIRWDTMHGGSVGLDNI